MNTVQELIPFNKACEEFVSGKYILADIKISSILKIVEADAKIRDIISSCCENFNFQNSFNKAIISEEDNIIFNIPNHEKEIVAFVYNLLSAFKNNTINFYDFLNKFYPGENSNSDFLSFSNSIITPFKNAINTIYSKRHILVETNDYQNDIYNKIKTTIKLILTNSDNYKLKMNEKEEFTLLLNSLYFASEKNDKKLVYSLMIGLDYFSKCNKKTRSAYLSLEECFA